METSGYLQEAAPGVLEWRMVAPPDLLGKRVRLVDCDDTCGFVTSHERFADGSERFNVAYWLNGKCETVQVERREIEEVT